MLAHVQGPPCLQKCNGAHSAWCVRVRTRVAPGTGRTTRCWGAAGLPRAPRRSWPAPPRAPSPPGRRAGAPGVLGRTSGKGHVAACAARWRGRQCHHEPTPSSCFLAFGLQALMDSGSRLLGPLVDKYPAALHITLEALPRSVCRAAARAQTPCMAHSCTARRDARLVAFLRACVVRRPMPAVVKNDPPRQVRAVLPAGYGSGFEEGSVPLLQFMLQVRCWVGLQGTGRAQGLLFHPPQPLPVPPVAPPPPRRRLARARAAWAARACWALPPAWPLKSRRGSARAGTPAGCLTASGRRCPRAPAARAARPSARTAGAWRWPSARVCASSASTCSSTAP